MENVPFCDVLASCISPTTYPPKVSLKMFSECWQLCIWYVTHGGNHEWLNRRLNEDNWGPPGDLSVFLFYFGTHNSKTRFNCVYSKLNDVKHMNYFYYALLYLNTRYKSQWHIFLKCEIIFLCILPLCRCEHYNLNPLLPETGYGKKYFPNVKCFFRLVNW